jgi:hypothetical protein
MLATFPGMVLTAMGFGHLFEPIGIEMTRARILAAGKAVVFSPRPPARDRPKTGCVGLRGGVRRGVLFLVRLIDTG